MTSVTECICTTCWYTEAEAQHGKEELAREAGPELVRALKACLPFLPLMAAGSTKEMHPTLIQAQNALKLAGAL